MLSLKKIIPILLLGLSFSSHSYSVSSHSFNSLLLKEDEKQVGILGNAKYGLNSEFEIGSQLLLLSANILNVSLKHLMFETENFKTSFNSHVLRGELEGEALSLGFWGIGQSYRYRPDFIISYGFKEVFFSLSDSLLSENSLDISLYSTEVGFDYQLNDSLVISSVLSLPTYNSASIVTDYIESSVDAFIFPDVGGIFQPFMMTTATYTNGDFNIEFGSIRIMGSPGAYLNLFWKWI